jgi:hypothetical protein
LLNRVTAAAIQRLPSALGYAECIRLSAVNEQTLSIQGFSAVAEIGVEQAFFQKD